MFHYCLVTHNDSGIKWTYNARASIHLDKYKEKYFQKRSHNHLTSGSRAGLEPRSGGKSVAVQPIVKFF